MVVGEVFGWGVYVNYVLSRRYVSFVGVVDDQGGE